MDKIFSVYAAAEDSIRERCTSLSLPATSYELLDVLSKTNVQDFSELYVEIDECSRFPRLALVLRDKINLCELNALAERLSLLDEVESTAFDGMLDMEIEKDRFLVPLSRLIDLACSTDCCHVLPEAKSYAQLGRFYAENGFVQEAEEIPDKLFDMLDFEKIGRKLRQSEGGVFTSGGYVVQHTELVEAYRDMDLTLKAPDYAVLLELTKKNKRVTLKLPAGPRELCAAIDAIGAQDWHEANIFCRDCRVPTLAGHISGSDTGVEDINRFAQKLADMDSRALSTYKALLEATQCRSLSGAEHFADTLDEYVFSAQIGSPDEMAQAELDTILSKQDAEMLIPHLNMYAYGQALLDRFGGVLTDYGIIERRDGRPVLAFTEPQPQQGGMEMM